MTEQRHGELLEQVEDAIRRKQYSGRTAEACLGWIERSLAFHGGRHPAGMGAAEVEAFLTHRAAMIDWFSRYVIAVERLWCTVKYEHMYLYDYNCVPALEAGLDGSFQFYNDERPHQSLGYRTPAEVYYACAEHGWAAGI
jgi:hypothetical protein